MKFFIKFIQIYHDKFKKTSDIKQLTTSFNHIKMNLDPLLNHVFIFVNILFNYQKYIVN